MRINGQKYVPIKTLNFELLILHEQPLEVPHWHSCTEDKSQYVGGKEGHQLNFKLGQKEKKIYGREYGGENVF